VEYREMSLGRIFCAAFEHGDDLNEGLLRLAAEVDLSAGFVFLLGAVGKGDVVLGPKESVLPPTPMWHSFTEGREVLAVGSIFREGEGYALHLHGATGRGQSTLTGCLRRNCEVFLTIEALILEISGGGAAKAKDAAGFSLLRFA
jgi:predicted DNA-binding protein with PD1-like motif